METTPMNEKPPAAAAVVFREELKERAGLEGWRARNSFMLASIAALVALFTALNLVAVWVNIARTNTEMAALRARIDHLEAAQGASSSPLVAETPETPETLETLETPVQILQELNNLSRAVDALRQQLDQRASQSRVEALEESLVNQSEVIQAVESQLERELNKSFSSVSEKVSGLEGHLAVMEEMRVEDAKQSQERVGRLVSRLSSAEDGLRNTSSALSNVTRRAERLEKVTLYSSCKEYLDRGFTTSGVYRVVLPPDSAFNVFCDMDTDGGGWLVFQRRKDGSEDFYRTWAEYERGFGNLHGEFWLGNKKLHELTSSGMTHLRVDMEEWGGRRTMAKYSRFTVQPSNDQYRLHVSGYTGTAGDGFSYHSGAGFTTRDVDHDTRINNCASQYNGAFWYKSCHLINPNGRYGNAESRDWAHVVWGTDFTSVPPHLKFIEMKLR